MTRQINSEGLALIKASEGLRLEKYQDVAGKWTIGYGHLILTTEAFPEPISEEAATALLIHDLQIACEAVAELVTVPLTDNQFAALVDFTFNLGRTALKNSTLLERLNAGMYGAIGSELLKWVYAGGRRVEG